MKKGDEMIYDFGFEIASPNACNSTLRKAFVLRILFVHILTMIP